MRININKCEIEIKLRKLYMMYICIGYDIMMD